MKKIYLLVAVSCSLLGGCAAQLTPAVTAKHVPLIVATERQDEWLHSRCEFKSLVDTTHEAPDMVAERLHANLGERIYGSEVAFFRCETLPSWPSVIAEMPDAANDDDVALATQEKSSQ